MGAYAVIVGTAVMVLLVLAGFGALKGVGARANVS